MKKHKSQPCPYCGKVYERAKKEAAEWALACHQQVCLTAPRTAA